MTACLITLAVLLLASTGACIVLRKISYTDGYNDGRDYEKNRIAERKLRETRAQAGIRAKTSLGAPDWYVTVSQQRRAVAMPGIPLSAFPQAAPLRHGTDTGELRSLTAAADLFIDRVTADGDAYRQGMSA